MYVQMMTHGNKILLKEIIELMREKVALRDEIELEKQLNYQNGGNMEKVVQEILTENNIENPNRIERCSIGHGNYVFMLDYIQDKKIIRMNDEGNLYAEYENFKYWVSKLKDIDVPVPNIVNIGKYKNYNYIILDYIDGKDLSEVYIFLTENQKMNCI